MNAAKLLTAFRSEFLSHIDDVDAQFNQFTQNFDHAYKRRNTRHSFIIGLTIALIFNLPFQRIYERASSMSQDDAIALAERTLALYERYDSSAVNQGDDLVDIADLDSTIARSLNDFRETLELIRREQADTTNGTSATITSGNYLIAEVRASPLWQWNWAWEGIPLYFLGCLVTALLTSFGAPFWKDITSLILRVQKRGKSVQNSQSSDA